MKKLLLAGVALAWAGGAEAARFIEISFSATGRGVFPSGPFISPSDTWFPVGYDGVGRIALSDFGTGSACPLGIPPYCINITQGRFIDNYLRTMFFVDGSAEFLGADFRSDPIGSSYTALGSINLTQNASSGIPRYDEELSVSYTAVLFEASTPVESTLSITPRPLMPAIPEPATWAMLISGFGVVGLALRRRRQVAVTG